MPSWLQRRSALTAALYSPKYAVVASVNSWVARRSTQKFRALLTCGDRGANTRLRCSNTESASDVVPARTMSRVRLHAARRCSSRRARERSRPGITARSRWLKSESLYAKGATYYASALVRESALAIMGTHGTAPGLTTTAVIRAWPRPVEVQGSSIPVHARRDLWNGAVATWTSQDLLHKRLRTRLLHL